jgi:hypothetical protein
MRSRMQHNSAQSGGPMKLTVFATAMTLLVMAAQPFASALDGDSIAATTAPNTAAPEAGEETPKAASDLAAGNTNIEDVGYTLERIHQEAINIYIESTRKKVKSYELHIVTLSAMPTTPLESQSSYLPLRKAWIAYFIGTMEPLVQILNEHIKHLDEKTAQSHMPGKSLSEWHEIVSEWTSAIKQLTDQLDVCASLVNDSAPDNVEVAKAARSIDAQVAQCDRVLQKASKFLHDNLPAS